MNPSPNEQVAPAASDGVDIISSKFAAFNARMDSDAFQAERAKRIAMLRAARAYFDGDHPRPLKPREGQYDPNIIINFCRRLIVKIAAWLMGDPKEGEMLKMEVVETALDTASAEHGMDPSTTDRGIGGSGDGGMANGGSRMANGQTPNEKMAGISAGMAKSSAANDWLKRVWEANGGAHLLLKIARRASIDGHIFIKVLPVEDAENDLDVPMLVMQDGENIAVLRKENNKERAEAFVIEWTKMLYVRGSNRETKIRQIVARIGSAWWIGDFADIGETKNNKWQPLKPIAQWTFAWSPIVDWQNLINDDFYGASDLEDLPPINDGINFAVSNVNRILYIHGHPRTVGTGFEASEVQESNIDSFWTVPNPEARVQNLEMQSDLGAAFAFIQFLSQSFNDIGRDLDLASLRDRIGQVTNFGLQVLANDAITKLGEKRTLYGKGLNQINRILLELGKFPVQDTKFQWLNPLPENELEEVARLKGEREMGIVSKQTAAEERGRDYEQEEQRIADEQAADGNLGGALLKAFDTGATFKALPRANTPNMTPVQPPNMAGNMTTG